jgi:hypothetical protein
MLAAIERLKRLEIVRINVFEINYFKILLSKLTESGIVALLLLISPDK